MTTATNGSHSRSRRYSATSVRVLVTGACGFIGSHLCEALLARGDDVVGVDNLNDFYDPRIKQHHAQLLQGHANFHFVRASILDGGVHTALQRHGADAVVHLAAWAGVRPSFDNAALYHRENVDGTAAVLAHVAQYSKPPRLVFASSSSVYGRNNNAPFHEDDAIDNPQSPYAATKRLGEQLVRAWHAEHGIDATCLRFFTVYGPRQRPEMAIHKFARCLVDDEPIAQYGDGSSSRDYTFVDDIVQGVLAAVDRPRGFRVYNLGNADPTQLSTLIEMLAHALNRRARIDVLPSQRGDVERTCADIQRARNELGYAPRVGLAEGLAQFARWFLSTDRRAS